MLSKSVETVVSKGVMHSIYPFYSEYGYGKKTSQKVLEELVAYDYCFKVHFDKGDRIIAKERASEFLSRNEDYGYFVNTETFNLSPMNITLTW